MNNKYNIGEKIIFIPGFTDSYKQPNYGGGGYSDPNIYGEIILTISSIIEVPERNSNAYFFENWTNGAFEFAIKSLNEVRNEKLNQLI